MLNRLLLPFALIVSLGLVAGPAAAENPQVALETSEGTMVIELYPEKAPETVKNFLAYVDEGFYYGTIFHRVIDGFMIQGGGFTGDMQKKITKAPVKNEADNGLSNARGTIAMARTSDPHSATAQFFINTVDNAGGLDHGKTGDGWGYTVFGAVVEGFDVMDKIAKVKTAPKGSHRNAPVDNVVIKSAKRVE
jgi:cyclophilin family peptidyl-prolyl cis-trans isomerase